MLPAVDIRELQVKGYTTVVGVFSRHEVDAMITAIENADSSHPSFRRTGDLFAIRRFLQNVAAIQPLIFTPAFKALVVQTFGAGYYPVRSIYFDKPPESNWFVAWHQDLTISVDRRLPVDGFGPWTVKGDQFAVQPPRAILEAMYTIRIHLDDTDETNGALRVLPGSHLQGVRRYPAAACGGGAATSTDGPTVAADGDLSAAVADGGLLSPSESSCRVPRGGIMIMRPLLQHASSRSTGGKRRRVIHIEFSDAQLSGGLNWAERCNMK